MFHVGLLVFRVKFIQRVPKIRDQVESISFVTSCISISGGRVKFISKIDVFMLVS